MGQLTRSLGLRAPLLAGRYQIEAALGRGAMGEVFRVRDAANGQRVALKRLTCSPQDRRAAAWFEREYHTLASLRHPRIISVFDYGHCELGPYYTMELLEGRDLREIAPLPYAQAVRHLADVASSLALLHARRLLHRDVSPGNVRASKKGHCKLIDFGALATFGSQREVVGVPPCVAPEALYGMPLDQRSDLYALGALAYYLLTGQHAYPARTIEELEHTLHAEPRSPADLRAEQSAELEAESAIPAQLDALVMSLLSLDPLARPRSAADVIEQLSSVAELEAPALPEVARGYLSGGRLVGRDDELREIRSAVSDVREGRGGALLIAGDPGVGKTRLLVELSLQAQLAGAIVARADGVHHDGPYGVVRELVARLCDALPEAALVAARPHAELLARFLPTAHTRLLAAPDRGPTCGAGELRARTQLALSDWFLALCAERPMVLIADDLDCADDASVALLARLARDGTAHGLLVCASLDRAQLERGASALRTLPAGARTLRPQPLNAEQTRMLLGELFGDVPNLQRLACFAHERVSGLPQRIAELSEALIAARVLRTFDGIWVIPEHIERCGLDLRNAAELCEARLAPLSRAARSAIDIIGLRRAALPVDLFMLIGSMDVERERPRARSNAHRPAEDGDLGARGCFAALDELIGAGLVVGSASGLRFAQESLRVHVEQRMAPARAARLHLELGELMLAQPELDGGGRIEAAFHVLRGGDETRGADLLAELGLGLVRDTHEMSAAVPALEAALAVYTRQGRCLRERCRLLGPLAVAGYVSDLRLAQRYGEEATVEQEHLLGLALGRRLRPWLGARLSLYVGLVVSAARFIAGAGLQGLHALAEAIALFVVSCNSLCGAAAICLDAERAGRYAQALEPLSWLGRDHRCGVAYRFAQALALVAEDRQAECASALREVIETVDEREVFGIDVGSRSMFLGGAVYALGAIEAFREGDTALAHADRLDALGLRLYAMAADQVRATHHANHGHAELAEHCRKRVELHAIDAGSGWQAEVWAPCATLTEASLTRDPVLLRRAGEQLQALAERVPSLARYAELAALSYRAYRNEPGAVDDYAQWLCALPPRSFNGWTSAIAMLGSFLCQRGAHARARELCGWALSQLSPRDLEYTALTLNLQVQHALALSGLGEAQAALAELDALLARRRADAGPYTLGFLHEQIARVAALADEQARVRDHVIETARCYGATGNASLIAIAARLRAELNLPSERPSRPSQAPSERSAGAADECVATAVISPLSRRSEHVVSPAKLRPVALRQSSALAEGVQELRARRGEVVLGLDALAERGRELQLSVRELDAVADAGGVPAFGQPHAFARVLDDFF